MQTIDFSNRFNYLLHYLLSYLYDFKQRLILLVSLSLFVILISSILSIIAVSLNNSAYYESIGYTKNTSYFFGLSGDDTVDLSLFIKFFNPIYVITYYIVFLLFMLFFSFVLPKRYAVCAIICFAGTLSNALNRFFFNFLAYDKIYLFYPDSVIYSTYQWIPFLNKASYTSFFMPYSSCNYFNCNNQMWNINDFVIVIGGVSFCLVVIYQISIKIIQKHTIKMQKKKF